MSLDGGVHVLATAAAVRAGRLRATDIAEQALSRIAECDPRINAVTRTLRTRAMAEAAAVDAKVAAGHDPGPLAGVPYGVKDLFDVAGLPTTAGAGMRRTAPPAARDAEAIRRLAAAGAVLVATLNMDEFAYGFVTDNAVWGITRNPHDVERFAGGSSGGSAAAVAAGMLPFTLGSDTNGSIRIPASLCGVYGLKPTHAGLPMDGVFPFAESLDDIGPFARTAADLSAVHSVLSGSSRNVEPKRSAARIALLGGWFKRNLAPSMGAALSQFSERIGPIAEIELPEVERARSAAFLMTAAEGGARHLNDLRTRPMAFDAATRDRLIAGAALSTTAYDDAIRFRATFRKKVLAIFDQYDILIAPSVFGPAPLIKHPVIEIDGRPAPARANLGLYTQPISFIGLPVVAAPLRVEGALPLGVQLIAAPDGESRLFALAHELEQRGLLGYSAPATSLS
jgi:aspartyl-tRNA(Asn)/glutamyl-tRNA(Gln) amidotransferase subunit A